MKKIVFLGAVTVTAAAAVIFGLIRTEKEASVPAIDVSIYEKTTVTIAGVDFLAFVADTDELRQRGLSGFSGLGEREAMLFKFESSNFWGFWMNDMLFPIDMVWLDQDMTVVSIEGRVQPESFPKVFRPSAPSRYVIELPAGATDELGLKPGEKAVFP